MNLDKICVTQNELVETLCHLKDNAEFDFDRLNTIIGIDLGTENGKFELIYDLYSTKRSVTRRIYVVIDRNSPRVPSVVSIYKSAYFDECEIYDMFGIIFDKNPNLKRLFMPKGWGGYPLRKDYIQQDERLNWNK